MEYLGGYALAVIAYQLFIVATLVLVRLVAPRKLILAALIWSALTLFNLFFPPLIALQLAVIWITFGIMSAERKGSVLPAHPAEDLTTSKPASKLDDARTGETNDASGPVARTDLNKKSGYYRPFKTYLDDRRGGLIESVAERYGRVEYVCRRERHFVKVAFSIAYRRLKIQQWAGGDPARLEMLRTSHPELAVLFPEEEMPAYLDDVPSSANDIGELLQEKPDGAGVGYLIDTLNYHSLFLAEVAEALRREPALQACWAEEMSRRGADDLARRVHAHLKSLRRSDAEGCAAEVAALSDLLPVRSSLRLEEVENGGETVFVNGLDVVRKGYLIFLDRREIERRVRERKIPYLLHFTRAANLASILANGLLSVGMAAQRGVSVRQVDLHRRDGRPDATCLSVSFPNTQMLYKYRQLNPEDDWVVLVISPHVLWSSHCAFSRHNAADSRISTLPLTELASVAAFDAMFAPLDGCASRREQRLKDYDPTDPQAEVLMFDPIRPSSIIGLVFDNESALAAARSLAGNRTLQAHGLNKGFFASREYARTRVDQEAPIFG